MKFPRCPICSAESKLPDWKEIPQTKEQFEKNVDTYICKNGHKFEATIPIKTDKDGYAIRADM